jgi:hypothetical protein
MKVLVINATNDDKVVGDLKYVTMKNPHINLQKIITWTILFFLKEAKVEKACVESGMSIRN